MTRIYINLKDSVQLNTREADNTPCAHCSLPISVIPGRHNRVDCDDGDKLCSYHIWCYDMAVMEKLSAHTMRIMIDTIKELGRI